MTTTTISLALIGLFLLFIFIIIAVRTGINKEEVATPEAKPIIHVSGIYSVVRRSPRTEVLAIKPSEADIRKYLAEKNEDCKGRKIDELDKENLIKSFQSTLSTQIELIESGDKAGAEFYFFDYEWIDPVCAKFLEKGQFVTREDLFRYPHIMPPFHPGCGCRLKRHEGGDKMKDTTEFGLRPFIRDESSTPELPDWKNIFKLPRG